MSEEKMREEFEVDAAPYGFDLARHHCAAPEPWSEYRNNDTGHRWAGWQAACAHKDTEFAKEREQLRALIAMQAEALKFIRDNCPDSQTAIRCHQAISASSESVAAWEAEKLHKRDEERDSLINMQDIQIESLRREVAMLFDVLKSCDASPATRWHDAEPPRQTWLDKRKQALNDTQATAEAYERELKAKVLEKLRKRMIAEGCSSSHPYSAIDAEIAELRAQSAQKKGGE